ncbi:hypothetical protein [Mesomycoplasma dispar]|uniref:Endonuclease n=1 Tax=Mesomycoplasma dispar TaxID=86660 RepID=A0ABM6PRJ5_9BACT|nr:hypothetical protein [Mesomycoplasma dispar]ATP59814.1 hypothetical protein CSW10_02660 [Mesomycoplasma dispar]
MSQFKGQGSQEITEAQNLGTVLEEIKKKSTIENLLFAGTTNIKKTSYQKAFEKLLKSYHQLLSTDYPTKIYKNSGYTEPMNSIFYRGIQGQPKSVKRIDWYGLEGYQKKEIPDGPKEPDSLKNAFQKYVNRKDDSSSKSAKKSSDSPNWEPLKSLSNHAPIVVEIDFEKQFDKEKLKEELEKEQGKQTVNQ